MQAIKLITRSLRLIRSVDADEAPEAKAAEDALDALNQMLIRWEADGISLGWASVSDVQDDLPLPEEAIEAVTFGLASQLAIEYGVAPEAKVEQIAGRGYNALLRDNFTDQGLSIRVGGCGDRWDIHTDSFGPRRY